MARGQVGASEKQLGTTNAIAGQKNEQQKKLESQLIPGYTSLMDTGFASPDEAKKGQALIDTGYFSPEDAGAATTSEMGAATAPFGAATFRARNTAAATRNAAGLPEQEDALALEEGRTAGDAASQLQKEKMANQVTGLNTKIAGQQAGMYGLNNLEAGNMSAMEDLYGLGPSSLQARAAGPGWAQGFHDVASGVGSVIGGLKTH